jgi:hypothetical protein
LNLLLFVFISSTNAAEHISEYLIGPDAHQNLRGRSAIELLDTYLEENPEMQNRLLDRQHVIAGESWSYDSQVYASTPVMRHLIARQIKAMAERRAVRTVDAIFDSEYGIGSKSHKDKGAIGNPLSFWGHPFQTEIIGQRSKRKALRIYHAFRSTLKNQLIRYARSQSLDWHRQPTSEKLDATLRFLNDKHPAATNTLRDQLKQHDIELEGLLRRAISSDLISKVPISPGDKASFQKASIAIC